MLYDPTWEVQIDSDIVRILRSAKEIISDPSRWICGGYARAPGGHFVDVEAAAAVSFCSVGALARALGSNIRTAERSDAYTFLKAVAEEQGLGLPHELNDIGHAKAMAMFDRAIELATVSQ